MTMTRRHTIGSRSETGLLDDPQEPQTPPPGWTPPLSNNKLTWRKPSKWQVCMPKLRVVTKVTAAFMLAIFLYQLLHHRRAPNISPPPPTEEQLRQIAVQKDWAWNMKQM